MFLFRDENHPRMVQAMKFYFPHKKVQKEPAKIFSHNVAVLLIKRYGKTIMISSPVYCNAKDCLLKLLYSEWMLDFSFIPAPIEDKA